MVNGWKFLKYISICLHRMKLTWVIQLCKNVFAINNGIIVLTFHELDLAKVMVEVCTGPSLTRGSYPARPVIFPTGRAGKCKAIFPTDWAGPADERWLFQRAGPGRKMTGGFSNGPANERGFFLRARPGRQKRNEPGPGLENRPVQISTAPSPESFF